MIWLKVTIVCSNVSWSYITFKPFCLSYIIKEKSWKNGSYMTQTTYTKARIITLVKRVYGAWEHVYIPVLSFSTHIGQRHVNITVLFIFWFKTVDNWDTYCIDNLNNPPIMFFVPNIIFSGVRIFTRKIHLHCTDISDTGVQMFLRKNDTNN